MYEYSRKILELTKAVFKLKHFKERFYRIFDWIKENKEYNIVTLNKLAEFYGVSLEWLVANTEVRTSSLTEIDDLIANFPFFSYSHPVIS